MLRLPTIRAQFPDLAEAAARDQMSYRGFLAELLMAECDDRARRRSERRIKAAAFPREKSLRGFDFEANPHIDPAVIHTLATCDWVKKGLPLCLIGDSGTGKSAALVEPHASVQQHRQCSPRRSIPPSAREPPRRRLAQGHLQSAAAATVCRAPHSKPCSQLPGCRRVVRGEVGSGSAPLSAVQRVGGAR